MYTDLPPKQSHPSSHPPICWGLVRPPNLRSKRDWSRRCKNVTLRTTSETSLRCSMLSRLIRFHRPLLKGHRLPNLRCSHHNPQVYSLFHICFNRYPSSPSLDHRARYLPWRLRMAVMLPLTCLQSTPSIQHISVLCLPIGTGRPVPRWTFPHPLSNSVSLPERRRNPFHRTCTFARPLPAPAPVPTGDVPHSPSPESTSTKYSAHHKTTTCYLPCNPKPASPPTRTATTKSRPSLSTAKSLPLTPAPATPAG